MAIRENKETVVGLVREVRRCSEKQQREMLQDECGRIWTYEERDKLIRYLRNGDVVLVTVAHVLGPTRHAVHEMMRDIFAKGAGIAVVEPEVLTARTGAEAATIALNAVAGLTGDSRAHTAKEARRHGKKSWRKKKAARTSFEVAHKFWKSRRGQAMIVEERMAQPEMQGWTITTFYRHLKLNT